jgi:colicin import membrane protein
LGTKERPALTHEQELEIAAWNDAKGKTEPAEIRRYIERYPNGSFVALAHILIEQIEKQKIAEETSREAEARKQEELRKQAEVKRLETLKQANEAKQNEQRRREAQAIASAEDRKLAELKAKEIAQRAAELQKAKEEAIIAKDAAKVAEQKRLAALLAAESARKAADQEETKAARASKNEASTNVAALPSTALRSTGSLDGTWVGHWGDVASAKVTLAGNSVVGYQNKRRAVPISRSQRSNNSITFGSDTYTVIITFTSPNQANATYRHHTNGNHSRATLMKQ